MRWPKVTNPNDRVLYEGNAIVSSVRDPRGNYVVIDGFNPSHQHTSLRQSIAVPIDALPHLIECLEDALKKLE